jgi:hypothetical protein
MLFILNVAIGIVFVYLLFSLIVSAANEVLQSILAKRKQYLWDGIKELLQDRSSAPPADSASAPSKQFSAHPLIAALSKGADGLPSYIPAELFATTLLDLIRSGALGRTSVSQGARQLEELISEIGNPGLQRALVALLRESEGDLKSFKTNIENWFNSAMDRVSGWYKRYTQYCLLGLAMLCAVICNVDSIHILQVLSTDPKIRQSLVDEAARAKKPESGPAPSGTPTLVTDWKGLNAQVEELDSLSLPIGWNSSQTDYFGRQWLFVIVGWLLTALAGSLGAPFWFDTLNRIMNIRGSGKVPDQPQGAKDGGKSKT